MEQLLLALRMEEASGTSSPGIGGEALGGDGGEGGQGGNAGGGSGGIGGIAGSASGPASL